jgi:hypothetical protein
MPFALFATTSPACAGCTGLCVNPTIARLNVSFHVASESSYRRAT